MNPIKIHQDYRMKVLDLLIKEKKPLNVTQVSDALTIAWATSDKILSALVSEGKVSAFKMGTSKCFEISLSAITEMLSNPNVIQKIKPKQYTGGE